jgi:glycosyltransferase involved in cell wall biosynthesis
MRDHAILADPGNSLVSVIIPTYNRGWSIRNTVRSVFEQTHRPIECIVVDDGSTDGTITVINNLNLECPSGITLRYYRQENGGPNSARNRGLREAHGTYISYLDSDDLLLPESIETRARILQNDSGVDFCYGLCSVRDEQGRELHIMNKPWPQEGQARIAAYLFHTNSPLIRRSTCYRVGLWKNADLHGQEYEYFARLKYFSKKVVFINQVLSVYRRHQKESIFQPSIEFTLALFRILYAIKGLVMYGPCDNDSERCELAMEFKKVAKRLYRLKDYSHAQDALADSLLLRFRARIFAQWFFTAAIRLYQGVLALAPRRIAATSHSSLRSVAAAESKSTD